LVFLAWESRRISLKPKKESFDLPLAPTEMFLARSFLFCVTSAVDAEAEF
jgi:hypothetical protein